MQLRLKKEKSTQKDALLQVRAAILFYKSMPQISEDRNPLLFWKARDSSGSMLGFLAGRRCKHVPFHGWPSLHACCTADDGQARHCYDSGWLTVAA